MQNRLITHVAIVLLGAFLISTYSSCKKEQQDSSITYVNDTYTPISIRVNGQAQTIPVGGSVSYIAVTGTTANVDASTAGTYGQTYSWSFTDNFPSDANTTITESLDVDASYFYLKAINSYASTTTQIEVNATLASQTVENISIPYDGNIYELGYYQAYGNTTVKAFYSDLTSWSSPVLSIPNTANASYTITLQ